MMKEEFLDEYVVSDEFKEYLSSGEGDMWWYCADDGWEGLTVCHFFEDGLQENTIVYEEYHIPDLDTEGKWKDLMEENGFEVPQGVELWNDGIEKFIDFLNHQYRWIEPPMYDPLWVPSLSEEIDV